MIRPERAQAFIKKTYPGSNLKGIFERHNLVWDIRCELVVGAKVKCVDKDWKGKIVARKFDRINVLRSDNGKLEACDLFGDNAYKLELLSDLDSCLDSDDDDDSDDECAAGRKSQKRQRKPSSNSSRGDESN